IPCYWAVTLEPILFLIQFTIVQGTRKPSNEHIQRALVGFINFSLGDNLVGLNGKVAVAEKLKPFFDSVVGNGLSNMNDYGVSYLHSTHFEVGELAREEGLDFQLLHPLENQTSGNYGRR
ncbi:TPA: hypothetical protein ACGO97_002131, partial [Streptococcus suis]